MHAYGALAYAGPDPVGPSPTYSRRLKREDCQSVSTPSAFLSAIQIAGAKIWIVGHIDLTPYSELQIANQVTIAGDLTGKLYTTNMTLRFVSLLLAGQNTHLSGIVLQGPQPNISDKTSAPFMDGLSITGGRDGLVVENCELRDWPYAAIRAYSGFSVIRHNWIHNCRKDGFGYGTEVGGSYALLEANRYSDNRHSIAGVRGSPTANYVAQYNIVESGTNTFFDLHGGNDTQEGGWGPLPVGDANVYAGGTVDVMYNTFMSASQTCLGARGVPEFRIRCTKNWSYVISPSTKPTSTAFKQRLDKLVGQVVDGKPITGNEYVRMDVWDNWHGMASPPESQRARILGRITV